MKKTIKILIFMLVSILIIGCGKESEQEETQDISETKETSQGTEETYDELVTEDTNDDIEESDNETEETDSEDGQVYTKASEYISFEGNTRYQFDGDGMEYSSFDVYVDFIEGDKIQFRTNNSGTEMVEVFQKNQDNITRNYFRGEVYYRENVTGKEDTTKDIVLKDPVKIGTTWNISEGRKSTITDVEVAISTPSGDYEAVEVTTESIDDDHGQVKEYYVKGLGLVKREFNFEDTKVTSTLSKIEKDVPLVQRVRFFYPDDQIENIVYDDKEVSFKTNDITRATLEKEYKNITKVNAGMVLPENSKINSLYLNQDGAVYIDFSKELVSEMNAGAGYEGLILQSIVNTFGNYYGENKVYLTVENRPYESGHILLRRGEKLEVNLDDVVE